MTGSFADRVIAAGLAATNDLPDGAALAVELRSRLEHEGLVCDEIFADEDGWCFFVSAQSCPVGVTLHRAHDLNRSWQVSAVYEGGLSGIWSEQNAREGSVLAARVRTLLEDQLARKRGPQSPAVEPPR